MRKRTLVAVVVAVSAALAVWAQQGQGEASTLERAREAYAKRAESGQALDAVKLFKEAAAADPKSYEALWEGAKACYFYGNYTMADASDSDKMAIFQDGIDRAKAAVALKPDGVEGHFWLGVLYGVYGEAKGIFKSLAMVPDIKAEMAKCMELDPAVEGYGPDRVLGRLYYKLPWFKGGDNKKSIGYLEKSLKGAPTNALTMLYLAESYKSEGMKPKALEQLKAILDMTPDPQWTAEHPSIKASAQKLYNKWS